MDSRNKLRIVFGDVTVGIHGEDFHYIFSKQTGGMESLVKAGKEWLYRTPYPTFWRATTDNDRGNGFPLRSGMWLGADQFRKCIGFRLLADGEAVENHNAPENNVYSNQEYVQEAVLTYTYETITVPTTTVDVSYTVHADGKIHVLVHYHGKEGLPELPVFGMRFIMPTKAVGYCYEGLSGETYPDRMAGGIYGRYEVEGLPVTPYLVPQECGMHMETEYVTIYRKDTLNNSDPSEEAFGLTFRACGEKFGFSCLPYTAEELENADRKSVV